MLILKTRSLLPLVMVVMVVSRRLLHKPETTLSMMTGVFCIWGFQVEGTDLCHKENQRKKMKPKWLE
jgi:hypothetical protein